MNVRVSPPDVMLSLLSPAFNVPGQVDPASAVAPLELADLEPDDDPDPEPDPPLLELDPELPELDDDGEPPELDPPPPELEDAETPELDPEFDVVPEPPFDPAEP